jgi:hypothetical protein
VKSDVYKNVLCFHAVLIFLHGEFYTRKVLQVEQKPHRTSDSIAILSKDVATFSEFLQTQILYPSNCLGNNDIEVNDTFLFNRIHRLLTTVEK